MSAHETFHFHSLADLQRRIGELGVELEATEDTSPLFEPAQIGPFRLSNRLVVLPMEGCDGQADGSPDTLTYRRYRRFAAGGAGLLWVEATAVVPDGRANPRQLWLHEKNIGGFASLLEEVRRTARDANGAPHRPLLILQLTHSGRYSRPGRRPQPIIAHHSPFLDPTHQLPAEYPLIADGELERLEEAYVTAARCAQKAGFDGVDVKACHRYLVSELLASHTRSNSRFGGSFENRTRFLRDVVGRIRAAAPNLLVTSRLNVYDAMAFPYGFGVDPLNPAQPDLAEPIALVGLLHQAGVSLLNVTVGNPYYNPHVNRPFDLPTVGAPFPTESPLQGVARFVQVVAQVQAAFPKLLVVGGGYSWLRQFFPHVAAANVRRGKVSLVGLGRLAFAYPDFARDLRQQGRLDAQKVCVACSACTQIMRDGGRTGCVPRDTQVYEPIYRAGRQEALDTIIALAKGCRQCNDPGCVGHCPAQVNIPRFVSLMAASRFREAYEVLREANVLTGICGYVCPAETLCEAGCLNQHYGAGTPIRHLQKWVSHEAVAEGWAGAPRPMKSTNGNKVVVIGAGPAGISGAATLASLGYHVTLLDRELACGGTARDAIPTGRLPDAMVRLEIQAVLDSYGDRIQRRPANLQAGYNLEHVLQEGYAAGLLALGLTQSVPLPGAERPKRGVTGALEFLKRAKQGGKYSGTVLVLGGGNTAIDAALSARQAGAEDVAIVYRRSFAELPAWPTERDEAIRAGIHFLTLTAPLNYALDDHGELQGLRVIRTKLGPADAQGRRTPQPMAGTEHVLPANLIVEAFGQRADPALEAALPGVKFTEQGLILTQNASLRTSRSGVYAAGDIVNGGTTVVQAVAEGARAAREIDEFLTEGRVASDVPAE